MHVLTNTTATFQLAQRAAIKGQVHCENLGYHVERRFIKIVKCFEELFFETVLYIAGILSLVLQVPF